MIPEHIRQLALEAIVKTAIQGRAALFGRTCLYSTDDGAHCGVGNALTPELQEAVGRAVLGVTGLCETFPAAADHLGVTVLHGQAVKDNNMLLWRAVQEVHDSTLDTKPFGISWSRWFWSKARNQLAFFDIDIGGFPRHLMKEVP